MEFSSRPSARRVRGLRLAAAAAAVALVSTACANSGGSAADTTAATTGASSSAASGPATLKFLAFTSPNLTKAFWEEQVANVQKVHPEIKVEILYTPTLDRQGYAKQLLATGQLPDVLWDAPLQDFVKAGALLPYQPSDYEGMLVPQGYGSLDGKQYSLFNGVFISPGMFYNKAAFEKAGVSVPTTAQELADAAKKLKAAGYTPFLQQSGADTWAAAFLLNAFINADVLGKNPNFTADLKSGKAKFSDPDFKAAVDRYVAMRDQGAFNSDALSINYAQANEAWASGKYAMWPMGGWAGAAKTTGFEAGVFVTPSASGAKVLPKNLGPSLYISATTKFPEAARLFATTIVKQAALQQGQMKSDAQFPVVEGVQPPEGVTQATKDGLALYADKSYTQVVAFTTEAGDAAFPSGFADEYNKAAQKLTGGGSAAEFISTVQSALDKLNK